MTFQPRHFVFRGTCQCLYEADIEFIERNGKRGTSCTYCHCYSQITTLFLRISVAQRGCHRTSLNTRVGNLVFNAFPHAKSFCQEHRLLVQVAIERGMKKLAVDPRMLSGAPS